MKIALRNLLMRLNRKKTALRLRRSCNFILKCSSVNMLSVAIAFDIATESALLVIKTKPKSRLLSSSKTAARLPQYAASITVISLF